MLKTIRNIPTRVRKAFAYSWDGLANAFVKEEAIRLECLAFCILLAVMLFVPWPLWKKASLLAVFLLVPLCELINSAIEDVCDLITRDFNEHVKNAKDKGSAAVLAAIVINLIALCALILV
jgi:diacylglycerol kinase (ATP)